jgi:hypothetical protein
MEAREVLADPVEMVPRALQGPRHALIMPTEATAGLGGKAVLEELEAILVRFCFRWQVGPSILIQRPVFRPHLGPLRRTLMARSLSLAIQVQVELADLGAVVGPEAKVIRKQEEFSAEILIPTLVHRVVPVQLVPKVPRGTLPGLGLPAIPEILSLLAGYNLPHERTPFAADKNKCRSQSILCDRHQSPAYEHPRSSLTA